MDPNNTPPQPAVVRRTVQEGAPSEPANALDQAPKLQEFTGPRPKGRLYTFRIPASARDKERDPVTMTLRELTPEDALTAARIATQKGGDGKAVQIAMVYESAKFSLYMVDGRQVDHAQFEGDALFGRWSPKAQALLIAAYRQINTTTDQEDADFLSSMAVS